MAEPKITPEYIAARIEIMKRYPAERENLEIESKLYAEILTAIANGECEKPRVCAKLAIKSQELLFSRYVS